MSAETITTEDTPTLALARLVQPLEPSKAAIVREQFAAMFSLLEQWQREARALTVADVSETRKMATARLLRLEMKKVRIELDKRRKAMKAGIILEGKAVDGAYAIFESLVSPLESHLLEQEEYAKRIETAKADTLKAARSEALEALGVSREAMSPALGKMSEDAWGVVLEDAKAARDARLEAARFAEEARIEAARIVAEQTAARKAAAAIAEQARIETEEALRAENARLEGEKARIAAESAETAALVEKQRAIDKQAAEIRQKEAQREIDKARADAAAREQEANDLRAKEAARVAAEAETKKPTKAKYAAMVAALREIVALSPGDARDIARGCLNAIGEAIHDAS